MKKIAIVFGVLFLLAGIAGFIPALTSQSADGHTTLFGLAVGPVHNIIHLLTGIIALWVGFVSAAASRKFFQIFGIVYLLVAILGFFAGEEAILGFIENNSADNWFHLVVAIISLVIGFSKKKASVPAMAQPAATPMQQAPEQEQQV